MGWYLLWKRVHSLSTALLQSSDVVDGDSITHLGELGTVALRENLSVDAHDVFRLGESACIDSEVMVAFG